MRFSSQVQLKQNHYVLFVQFLIPVQLKIESLNAFYAIFGLRIIKKSGFLIQCSTNLVWWVAFR